MRSRHENGPRRTGDATSDLHAYVVLGYRPVDLPFLLFVLVALLIPFGAVVDVADSVGIRHYLQLGSAKVMVSRTQWSKVRDLHLESDQAIQYRGNSGATYFGIGLAPDELAFYDAVATNYLNLYNEAFLRDLIHDVVQVIKRSLKVDWTQPHREDVKAAVRAAVKRVLRRRNVRAEDFEERRVGFECRGVASCLFNEIQAEVQSRSGGGSR